MMIFAAIIARRSHFGGTEYLVNLYDQSQPRLPNSERLELRYACISQLGPFRTRTKAENIAAVYPELAT